MNKIKFLISYIIYNTIAKNLPSTTSPFSIGSGKLRVLCAKNIIKECGKNVNIEKGARFSRLTKLGDFSGIGINAKLHGQVIIGDNVMMGPECIIYTQNHEFKRTDIPMRNQGFRKEEPVIIGNDVWIGGRVIILPGVKVGNGVVIGAGTVVTKDIPDNSIVGGNPMRILKTRN